MQEKSVIKGSFLVLMTRLCQKSLGLVSTLILARLLLPEDFGVIAFLMMTINFFYVLSGSGSYQYILSKENITKDEINTAFTVNFILRSFMWLILVVLAPFISGFFGFNDALPALYLVSIVVLLRAVKNPGFELYQKELNYKLFARLEVSSKFLSTVVVLVYVYLSPSYMAIVFGEIVLALCITVGSYLLHPYKPKFAVLEFSSQWAFSKWMMIQSILGYSRSELDQVATAKIFTEERVGQFYLFKDIAMMPVVYIIRPITEPFLPFFSRKKGGSLEYYFIFTLWLSGVLSIPLSIYIYLYSKPLVKFFLGENWENYHDIFGAFSMLLLFSSFMPVISALFIAKHYVKVITIIDMVSVPILLVVLYLSSRYGLVEMIFSRGLFQGFIFAIYFLVSKKIVKFSFFKICLLFFPVFVSIAPSFFTYYAIGVDQNLSGFFVSSSLYWTLYFSFWGAFLLINRNKKYYSEVFVFFKNRLRPG